jgi:hypothetical protein
VFFCYDKEKEMFSMSNFIKSGKVLSYFDLEKIAPKEFEEFNQEIENMLIYLKLNEVNLKFEELVSCLEIKDSGVNPLTYSPQIEFVIRQLKPFYQELKQAFFDTTGLRMWFYWTPAQKELQVRWSGVASVKTRGVIDMENHLKIKTIPIGKDKIRVFNSMDSIEQMKEMVDCTDIQEKIDAICVWLTMTGYKYHCDEILSYASYLVDKKADGMFFDNEEDNKTFNRQLKELLVIVDEVCERFKSKTGIGIKLRTNREDVTKYRFQLDLQDVFDISHKI